MAGQWRRQTRKQEQESPGIGPQIIANVFDAVKLIGTDPVTPDANTLYKGLIPKAWLHYDQTGTPAILDDENIDSITDGGTGVQTHNLDRDFSGADSWCVVGMVTNDTGGTTNICPGYGGAPAAGSVLIHVRNSDGVLADRADCAYVFFGRQT